MKFPPLPRLVTIPEFSAVDLDERRHWRLESPSGSTDAWLLPSTVLGLVLTVGLAAALAIASDGRAALLHPGAGTGAVAEVVEARVRPDAHEELLRVQTFAPSDAPSSRTAAVAGAHVGLRGRTARLQEVPAVARQAGEHPSLRSRECEDDEELFKGLCYRKCSLLTREEMPIRTSPWSCCRSQPCHSRNQVLKAGFCSGFDVGGHNAADRCPHTPRPFLDGATS